MLEKTCLATLTGAALLALGLSGVAAEPASGQPDPSTSTEAPVTLVAEADRDDFTWVPEETREGLVETDKSRFDTLLVNPDADFTNYERIYLEPLVFALTERRAQRGVTNSDQSYLAGKVLVEFERTFKRTDFEIVERTGPGVLVVALAVTDVEPNRDILGTFPTERGIRTPNQRSVGIGSITLEGVFTDGGTGMVIGVAEDRFTGQNLRTNTNLVSRWGDARDGMRYYARRLRDVMRGN